MNSVYYWGKKVGGGGRALILELPAAFGGRLKHKMLKLPYKKWGDKTLSPKKWGGLAPPSPPYGGEK